MKIIEIKDIEDCFDGSFIKELLFDREVTKEFILYLGKTGDLDYYPTFARPFYKIDSKGKFQIKGVEGNKTARITLYEKNFDETLIFLKKYTDGGEHEVP